jgi:hypothetical protein
MTKAIMTVMLPFPDRRLNPNSSKGKHWASTAALRKSARIGAKLLALDADSGCTFAPGAEVALVLTFI